MYRAVRHLIWLTAVILVQASLAAFAGTGPRIQFDKPAFDFGSMYQEDSFTHDFAFRNVGDAPLKIGKVTSSCGCTAVLPPEDEIAPGKSAVLKITFHSGRMRSKVVKHVYVESNDHSQPRYTLTFTGVVKREVEIKPGGIFLGNVKPGDTIERDIFIRPVDVKSFHISEVRTFHKAVSASDPEPIDDKQGGYRIRVRIGPVSPAERIYSYIIVRTDLKHAKDLRITVYASVRQAQASPPRPAR